jgi:CMP-N-acetylneuraminic acid synthetase
LIQTFHPFRAYSLAENDMLQPLTEYTSEHFLQKQDRPPAYGFTGGFYIRRRKLLENWDGKGFALGANCVGEVVPEHAAVDINTPVDFLLCESILAHKDELEGKA